mmetsp:Transcript_34235/g.78048  ORF Transcript_34235/g.78048 Transcript_34235/m.78048 type:complete len:100 (-) Transcript_34235:100-399(-)
MKTAASRLKAAVPDIIPRAVRFLASTTRRAKAAKMVNPALSATSVCGNHRRTRVDTKDVELQQHLENSRQHRKLEMKATQPNPTKLHRQRRTKCNDVFL